jgi:hypothetical protein
MNKASIQKFADIHKHHFFVVAGAAKSGTSSLYSYLNQHPQIGMSAMKEARYLTYLGKQQQYRGYGKRGQYLMNIYDARMPKTMDEYLALFDFGGQFFAYGECSPAYLYISEAAQNIYKFNKGTKIIIILRNPVERAYSSYLHMRRENAESGSFYSALLRESERIEENSGLPWRYVAMGQYGSQLKRFKDVFDESAVKVFLYDELKSNAEVVMSDLFEFIGVDASFSPNLSVWDNVSGIPRNYSVYKAFKKVESFFSGRPYGDRISRAAARHSKDMLDRPSIDKPCRDFLIEHLADEVQALSEILGKDLSHWLK